MSISTPVAWYNLNEVSGSRADSSGNGRTLTDNNTVGSTTGVISNAASFVSASSEYLSRAHEAALQLASGDFTVTMWLRFTDFSVSYPGIIGKAASGGASGWGLFMNGTSASQMYSYLGGGANTINLSGSLSTATWYHVVWRRSGSAVTVWVNGASSGSYTQGGTTEGTSNMGVGFVNADGSYFNGDMDLIGLYAEHLSDADVATLYNGGAGYDPTASSTTIKTLDGVTNANIKTILGVTRANVKTWNGVT